MKLEEAISKRIITLCREKNLPLELLSGENGISPSALDNILSGKTCHPHVSTIERICSILNISLADFFVDDLFRQIEKA